VADPARRSCTRDRASTSDNTTTSATGAALTASCSTSRATIGDTDSAGSGFLTLIKDLDTLMITSSPCPHPRLRPCVAAGQHPLVALRVVLRRVLNHSPIYRKRTNFIAVMIPTPTSLMSLSHRRLNICGSLAAVTW
jgi:hypothetical protein